MLLISLFQESHGGANISWLLWVAFGFFALMVLVGWLTSRKNEKEVEPVRMDQDNQAHTADDLTALEGIGPKVAQVLKSIGITSFAELAKVDVTQVKKALVHAGLQMMEPTSWIEQAKLAAKGDTDGLKTLQAELRGGRKVK